MNIIKRYFMKKFKTNYGSIDFFTTRKSYIIFFLLAVLINNLMLFYRRPDAFFNPQFFAEDASIFFSQVYHYGVFSFLKPYAGYYHLYPRIIAFAGETLQIPLLYLPAFYNFAWLLGFNAILIYLWVRLDLSTPVKFLLSLALTITPVGSDIFMNLTNTHWVLALGLIIIFAQKPAWNYKILICDSLFAIIIGFSGPFSLLFIPFIVVIFFINYKQIKKNIFILPYLIVFVAGIFQLFILLNSGIEREIGNPTIIEQIKGFIRIFFFQFAYFFAGDKAQYLQTKYVLLILLCVLPFFIYFILKKIKNYKENLLSLTVLFFGLLIVATTLYAFRYKYYVLYGSNRYYYIPSVTLVWFFILSIKINYKNFIFALIIFVLFAVSFFINTGSYEFKDFNWKYYSDQIKTRDTLTVPVNPYWILKIDNLKREKNKIGFINYYYKKLNN